MFTKRKAQDNYPTPNWCFEALTPFINWSQVVKFLEPCAGDGRIYQWAARKCFNLFSYEIRQGTDYFMQSPTCIDLIVTNPPYSLAIEFLMKGLTESKASAWLLRLNFLASQSRKKFFVQNPLSALYVLSRRPSFVNGRTDSTDYAWFIWDRKENPIFNRHGIIHI